MSSERNTSEDMWTPYKELQHIVETVVSRPADGVLKRVEGILKKHKQNFINLLKNPPKNAKSREELRKGTTDGIDLPGLGHQILSKELVDEAIIISDMYDLNEYVALDLLCTAQQQMPYHPGLTRGLVAVLLYYDGRKAIAATLRALVQARRGFSWTLETTEEIVTLITKYTQELMDSGLINKILELLHEMDLSKEVEMLQENRALGGPKHHHQVVDLYQNIRQILADVVYFWAAQSGLPKEPTFKLINYIKSTKLQEEATGGIDGVTLALEMALLYALDLSIVQRREDGEQMVQKLPLLSEPDFMNALLKELYPSERQWECVGLQMLTNLAWGLALATMRFLPSSMLPREEGITDEDEVLVDSAIEMNAFDFLRCTVLENDSLYKEEFYVRRLHTMLTDFIVLMPAKLKELRNGAEDSSRTMQVYAHEGIEPPTSLPRHYEHFMLAIARLYKGAGSHQSSELVLDYWGAIDGTSSGTFARSSSRQAALFKFICGGADMLQPMVFVSYMRMLCSLVCHPVAARHAFNLLKQNVLGGCVSISWDHFFQSLNRYYTNLRQELPPSTDTVYRHRSYPRGITPQEIQGLQAVLAVIRAVADQDEMARLALCENPNWASLTILLGLVSCSVPIPLKAELLLTLAALAKSPDTASALWHNLEASQILTTVPSTSSYQPRGIQTELEEIESRNEEFPLTRALLHLLNVLTDMPIPRLLGVGTRTPGFDPYLNFVINSVFLRFNNRSYKHADEKWAVAKSCLQLLAKLLTQYEPRTEDFVGSRVELQGGGMTQVNPPPGYHIMVQLNTKSELLHLVLYLLDESCRLLDTYSNFAGKEALEESMLSCLELLDRGLILQQKFFGFLSSSGSSMLLTGLNKLLLGVNPRSGRPDHLLNVAKFVTYNTWLPRQSFAAVRILISETQYPPSHTQILGAFTSTTATKMEIRHGFVECLEAQDDEIIQGEDLEVEEMGVICRTKEAIYKLMQQCLSHSPPNLSHYLLGFDINKDIKKTVFQQPGVMGFPRTCLHSLLGMLDTACQARKGSFFLLPKPRLLDAGYCMLYSLCANNKTSEPVLRFLRSSDFLARHLDSLPFTKDTTQSLELNQMAWLLKTAAIELKVTSTNMHQSQLVKLVELLIRDCNTKQTVPEDEPEPLSRMHLATDVDLIHKLSVNDSLMGTTSKQISRILQLINFIKFSVERVTPPNWEFFDPAQIDQVLVQCETRGSGSNKLIDAKKLHRILVEELSAIQGSSTAGQRQLIVQEIQAVLRYALKLNSHRSIVGSTVHYVDAWRQMTEVLFAVSPPEVLSFEIRKHLILEAIRLLLDKVLQTDSLVELASLSSGVLLLLMVNLRHCLAMEKKEVKFRQQKDQLMISGATSGNTSEKDENEMSYLQTKITIFKVILLNMLEWIVKSGVGSQQLRANLYGALLNFLHIVCESSKPDTEEEAMNEDLDDAYESQLDSTIYSINQKSNKEFQASVDIIVSFGERLMDVLCHDCIGGHDVCKMLALSCLDMVLEIDPHTSWFTYLSSHGYLKHIIDSLMDADDKLIALLDDVPATLRPLYLYESKMALLCRIASSHSGAELLLEHGTVSCISSMAVFSHHPQIQVSLARSSMNMETDFVPSITSRYLQIVFPALDLCHALLTALGTDNQSCTVQIMQFMISHSDMVTMVLHTGSPFNQLCDLQELAKLTGVIARSSRQDLCHISTIEPGLEKSSQLLRIQKLMLALLPRFIVTESLIRELSYSQSSHERSARTAIAQQEHNATPKEDKVQSILCFFQVACNLLLYVRNILSSRSTDQRISTVVFKPSIVDSAVAAERRNKEYHVLGEGTVLGLGVVVQQLIQCVEHYHREKAALDILNRKLASVPNMNTSEFKEYLPESSQVGNIASSRLQAAHHLNQCINHKQEELEYCSFLVENCLYLIWCHLDFYMLRALPPRAFSLTGSANFQTELTWNVTAKDISSLKQGLVSVFTDSLSKKLVEIKQDHGSTEKGFVEVLLRRIKRLIQFVPVK